jgi:hypothetical protein
MGRVSEQPGRYQRSPAGMIGAMVVLVGVVLAFVVLRDLVRPEVGSPVRTVDYRKSVEFGRDQVDFPLLAPERLPEGWRATSVRVVPEPARWHLGVLTDENRYVGLEQSRSSEEKMVERYVDQEAVRGRPVRIAGETWRTWTDEGGDTGLTRVEGGVTTLVVGTAGQDVLVGYVKTLRAR